jgi:hypothetical protein
MFHLIFAKYTEIRKEAEMKGLKLSPVIIIILPSSQHVPAYFSPQIITGIGGNYDF